VARPDKVAAVADVKDRFESSAALLLTNYRGLTVGELAELRAELRKANASYRVSKNTLIRRAMHDAGVEGLDEMLVGPTALVFCADDPVGPAKALKAFTKDHPQLEFKGGFLEGGVLDADAALKLADLESREDLLTRLAGLMHGALANTARLLAALPEKQARLLQALVDDGGFAGGDGAEATEAADQAAAATTDDEPEAAADADEADADTDEPEAAADDANAGADEPEAATDDEPEAAADEPAAEADDEPEASDDNDDTAAPEPESTTDSDES
jgi:large subunit ribosomal protein L10